MLVEENKAIVRRWFEEYNKGKIAAIAVTDELCAPDVVYHGGGEDIHGLENLKQVYDNWFNSVPDRYLTIEDMIAEENKVVVRYTLTGTHKGEWRGIHPTNKKVTYWGIEILRIAGGKIAERWPRADALGLMQQLGVVPTSKKKE